MKPLYPFFTYQFYKQPNARWIIPGICLLICLMIAAGAIVLPSHLFIHAGNAAAYAVMGIVFDDYNQNGTMDSREPGINGVLVTAYDATGAVVATDTTKTAGTALGQYTLSIASGVGQTRVQFTNFGANSTSAALSEFQSSMHLGGTSVAFVDGSQSSNTVNFGLEIPSEYCQNNPNLATSCYVRGDQRRTTNHVVVRFPYTNSGNTTAPTPLAAAPEVGTTWGMAYRRSSDTLFAAAYFKRHTGLKPGGSTCYL